MILSLTLFVVYRKCWIPYASFGVSRARDGEGGESRIYMTGKVCAGVTG